MRHPLTTAALLAIAGTTGVTVAAPRAGAQRPLTRADYARWETLGPTTLSADGRWVAYEVRRESGPELHWRSVGARSEERGARTEPLLAPRSSLLAPDSERVVPRGNGAAFTRDGRWLLYAVAPDTAGRPVPSGPAPHGKVAVVDLRTGTATTLDDVQSFALARDGAHVALRRYAPAGRNVRIADVVVRDLAAGAGGDVTFGNVTDFAWSDDGRRLAMTIEVEGRTGHAVQVLDVATGALRSLDAGDAPYVGLQWRRRASDLAVLRTRVDSAFVDTSVSVVAWRGLATAQPTKQVYDFATDAAFPAGMRVAAYRRPRWSDDGATLFVGVAPREPKPASAGPRDPYAAPARVEVWHWKDVRQYHQQDREADQDRQKTLLAAWHLAPSRLTVLADTTLDVVDLDDRATIGVAWDERPYRALGASGRPYGDLYRIDVATGARERIAERVLPLQRTSAGGRYVLYPKDGQWWAYDAVAKRSRNLTGALRSTFVNAEDDHPFPERLPYGVAGWTPDDGAVLLYDRYDVWRVRPDGTNGERLTRGREDSTVYRYVALDSEARTIDLAKPVALSAFGEWTKRSGYARLTPGKGVERLVWRDRMITGLTKARDADAWLYVQQSYEESPNVFVGGPRLDDARMASHTNAFQRDVAWGRQELLPYVTPRGDTLQMMLTYPAGYQAGRQYPMVVYYYERLSQGFHQYVVPSDRSTYGISEFAQNGYFVLRPDVTFRPRDPGWSGLECVTAAVKTALATGMIDPKRVGNMGHSWGGYQSAFYAVHGNGLFAATIAGAPLTDLVSFYGYTSFNTGHPETGHLETGQERMEVPLWEDPQAYIRNSTVFAVDSLQTPLLLEEGDADGNVNYWQSVELYNFGKRLGKEVVFLVYNGENHGVARPESRRDYHTRQLEWFAHYLKGEPAAPWIAGGETFLARQRLLRADAARDAADPMAPSTTSSPTRAAGDRQRP